MAAHFVIGETDYQRLALLPAPPAAAGQGHPVQGGQIDINTATEAELDRLPGIGQAKASAIVAWRTEHGPFRYPEELIQVPGIGEGILAEILNQITAGGE